MRMRNADTAVTPATMASGINALLGLWLIVAPFVLGYTDFPVSMWNAIIVGIVVACIAGLRFFSSNDIPALSWFNVALGIWLIVAPFIFGNGDVSQIVWNHVLVGIAIAVLAAGSALWSQQSGSMSHF